MINPMPPGVYKLKHDSKAGYYLEFYKTRFDVAGKNYGKIDQHISLFWERFSSTSTSMGVMLTGAPGSGKTRVSEILSNIGIDHNMCVVLVTEIKTTMEIIPFIDSLHNMVVMFDEFSKNFDMKLQNKMLTMFSSIGGNRKLFIITENSRRTVSPYIRTRPGRIRYAVDYDRVSEEVIIEYCNDYHVTEEFISSIMEVYQKAAKFTFDHLQALVSESLSCPNYTIDDLLEVLNLDDLIAEPLWYPSRVDAIDSDGLWDITNSPRGYKKSGLNNTYFSCWVDIKPRVVVKEGVTEENSTPFSTNNTSLNITRGSLDRIEDQDTYIFKVNGFLIAFAKRE